METAFDAVVFELAPTAKLLAVAAATSGVMYAMCAAASALLITYPSLQAENLAMKTKLLESDALLVRVEKEAVEKCSDLLSLTESQKIQLKIHLDMLKYMHVEDAPLPSVSVQEVISLRGEVAAQNQRATWLTYGEISLAGTIFLLYMFPFLQGAEERRQRRLLEQQQQEQQEQKLLEQRESMSLKGRILSVWEAVTGDREADG